MVERIRNILQARGLTPTQFADAIGVARPIVSHILSGRNKPSLEVVQKIIAAFPDLSLPWLLSGLGEMTAVSGPPTLQEALLSPAAPQNKPTDAAAPKRARVTPPRPAPAATAAPADTLGNTATPPALESIPTPADEPVLAATPTSMPTPAATPAIAEAAASALSLATSLSQPDKAIRRIVIFYQDGTFADYRPE
ncbi:DNA-binding transcriptional regulator, XRE-family HTH domain [Hymenobacter daecheongensis DSM 21074]|uniref:DNA-binding transcriptional regulator, XRE-family HTH domain n=1 Tax=Hymenobacter daecheongensis DSM 21074 TaxID=1121955 RepID=A0A1M6HSX3_9BACT|nr:helix-turn-helix transcriptional regulator [Hymenobacter daecheongensis]SHJ25237.1 DNA-binding transcriptional regulator, XRE-family HTH domain [Hymenobacter daecheongensis DSM 21074]